MTVHWSEEALKQLRRIESHIAKESPLVAPKVIARIIKRTGLLETTPRMGRSVPEYPEEDLYEILERPWRTIYRIEGERVEIVTVKHYRQLLPSESAALKGIKE
mgnify:CR=1 FL=1